LNPSHCKSFAGRIQSDQSLFSYPPGKTADDYQDVDFVPVFEVDFGSDTAAEQKANDICSTGTQKQKEQCIFDFFLTGSESFANNTLNTAVAAAATQAEMGEECL
jgi:hypothetical protein